MGINQPPTVCKSLCQSAYCLAHKLDSGVFFGCGWAFSDPSSLGKTQALDLHALNMLRAFWDIMDDCLFLFSGRRNKSWHVSKRAQPLKWIQTGLVLLLFQPGGNHLTLPSFNIKLSQHLVQCSVPTGYARSEASKEGARLPIQVGLKGQSTTFAHRRDNPSSRLKSRACLDGPGFPLIGAAPEPECETRAHTHTKTHTHTHTHARPHTRTERERDTGICETSGRTRESIRIHILGERVGFH